MPGARDGARNYSQRIGSHKEVCCQICRQSSILHTNLDAYCPLFGNVELEQFASGKSQKIADCVVAEYNAKSHQEQHQAVGNELVVDARNHSADNARKADDTQARHNALRCLELRLAAEPYVQRKTDAYRYYGHYQYVDEHPDGIDIDALTCKPQYKQRCHNRCEQG